ncbi:transcription factor SPT20 homolog [Macrosteles quadrilineatus]|uniref:transcription factor SPT20 homolog n=1 Tax=Macrosteles quadrilineatus TaxID=74068 RepID=UPI0023E2B71C|nr:transcription factor SPT20 homolog [Macrosteles quadrilineatus]
MRVVLLTALLALAAIAKADDSTTFEDDTKDDRDKRQTPFYSGGLTGFRPTPKPQPFTGGLQQTNLPRFQGQLSSAPQGFRTVTPVDEEADEIDRNTVSPTPQPLVLRQQQYTAQPTQYRPAPSPTPQVVLRSRPQPQQSEYRRPQQQQQQQRFRVNPQQQLTEEQLEELEEEKEEPDRLTLLLPQSKFDCHGLKTGYYADEGLNCEVFHYCQDNARHSWICPEGFLFHQVHLICMPPSSDNICQQSSQYHFVNDFLYKPINQEEFDKKPNVTLRYSDRYYPENYYEEGQAYESRPVPVKASRPVQQPTPLRPSPSPQQFRANQVFHSPEEVNIPLQHRRPVTQPQRTYPTTSSEEYEY